MTQDSNATALPVCRPGATARQGHRTVQRHRHRLKFLRCLDKESRERFPCLVLDNYGTHTHANVKAWLKRHPRFVG